MILENEFRKSGGDIGLGSEIPWPMDDVTAPRNLINKCPIAKPTELVDLPELALQLGVGKLSVKDESSRMGLGSFKALGAAYVLAHDAEATGSSDQSSALAGKTYVAASAGNHGLSLAAGANIFGAKAVIYLSNIVPIAFGKRLEAMGAEVRYQGSNYKESFNAAKLAEVQEGFTLFSDSSWDGYTEIPRRLMQGYLVLAEELDEQLDEAPTHIFLQAGVGGMAVALAAYGRKVWGNSPIITVVEPDYAPALIESIRGGKLIETDGPVSNMGRLDCKEPSLIALKGLARDADHFLTISDQLASEAVQMLEKYDIQSTPSGAGGLAGLLSPEAKSSLGLNSNSRVLVIVSEGPE